MIVGETVKLGTSVEFPVNSKIEWYSSNNSVASVDKLHGDISARKEGVTKIIASINNAKDECIVTVSEK